MSISVPVAATALRVQRAPVSRISPSRSESRPPLGAIGYGARGDVAWMNAVNAPVLGEGAAMADLWLAGDRIESGRSGAARWRSDGHWLLGSIDLEEGDGQQGLEQLSRVAYRDLFAALRQAGCPHLLRIWNYLPRINEDGGGLERYRQFNLGRQHAFIEAGQGVHEGSPAACALGVQRGALSIRFLAGQRAPLAIENPRQVPAYRYPSAYGPRPPTFSRAALADLGDGQLALFISGTASIVGHATVHVGDVAEQTRETLRNLDAVVAAAKKRSDARFDLRALDAVVYVRHAADVPLVRRELEQALDSATPTVQRAIYIEADICRQDLLVEIEAHAVAAGVLYG